MEHKSANLVLTRGPCSFGAQRRDVRHVAGPPSPEPAACACCSSLQLPGIRCPARQGSAYFTPHSDVLSALVPSTALLTAARVCSVRFCNPLARPRRG